MFKACVLATATLLCIFTTTASASIVLEDFESGSDGWTAEPLTTWAVGGITGGNPQPIVSPPQGDYFARSGEPNLTEQDTGTFTSPKYFVTYSTLQWLSAGYSGDPIDGPPDGKSYFEILDVNFVQKTKVEAPQLTGPDYDDPWATPTVNLLAYFAPGDAFYFRAVDGHTRQSYGWLAFDKLELTGDQLEVPTGAVPEASTFLIWGVLGLSAVIPKLRRRQVE